MNPNTPEDSPILAWEAPREEHHQRTRLWYGIVGTLALALVIYSIVTGAWTFSLVLALIIGLYAYTHRTPPQVRRIALHETGVAFEGKFFGWAECNGFWILEGRGSTELHIELKNRLRHTIVIHTGPASPYEVHEILSRHLPEFRDRREKILDAIFRICKL